MSDLCYSVSPSGLHCTEPKGHAGIRGPHRAKVGGHDATWEWPEPMTRRDALLVDMQTFIRANEIWARSLDATSAEAGVSTRMAEQVRVWLRQVEQLRDA